MNFVRQPLSIQMSFEINWERLQDADGDQLSETIRAFLDQRFKEMTLPSYLKSISVTSFDLGNIAPDIVIRRITDPFPEFYMDDDDEEPVVSGAATAGNSFGRSGHSETRNVRRDETDNRSAVGSTSSEPPAYETDESESGYPVNGTNRSGENHGALPFNSKFRSEFALCSIANSII